MDTQVTKSDGAEEALHLVAQNGDCSNTKDDHNHDPLMKTIGDFGRWQLLLLTCHIYTNIYFIWQVLANKFLASQQPPDFVCVPEHGEFGETVDQCFYTVVGDNVTVPCDKWEYSNSSMQNTIAQRFDLVCDRVYLSASAQSLFFAASLLGALVAGPATDRLGRKTIFLASLNIAGAADLVCVFAPTAAVWICARCVAGAASIAVNLATNVFRTEIVGGRWRSLTPALFAALPSQVGHALLGLVAFIVPNASVLHFVMAGMGLVSFPLWWLMPESPRWLLVRGQKEKALTVIRRAAAINRKRNDLIRMEKLMEAMDKQKTASVRKASLLDLIRYYPGMRRNFLILLLVWMSFTLGYYGIIYFTPSFDWNPYLIFVFPTFFTIPATVVSPYVENKMGRKFTLTVPLFIAGALAVVTPAIPDSAKWAVVFFCTASVVCSFISLNVAYTYTKELFPTPIRTTTLSSSSAAARVAAITFPLFASALGSLGSGTASLALFGGCMIGAAIASVWLWPETLKTKLPDTMKESEDFTETRNTWLQWSESPGPHHHCTLESPHYTPPDTITKNKAASSAGVVS